ncbi:MAG: twin-arginine translocase TatA/TatE family subunit [Acidobacteria bacterium]|nr:twin-arginine translocase TatA/TatE family subunit [Acidobacteriota bacterium]
MIASIFKPFVLFIFSSPQDWLLVAVAAMFLFGANKLPELAKSLGKTRKAFREGMLEAENEPVATQSPAAPAITPAALLDDDALLAEIQRRRTKNLEADAANRLPEQAAVVTAKTN